MLQRDNFWWEDRSCLSQEVQKKTVAPICQHDSNAASTTDTPPTTTTTFSCPAGWEEFQGHCYGFFNTYMYWKNAENDCIIKGGHLASIHSNAEQDFIYGQLSSSSNILWLGGSDALSEVSILPVAWKVLKLQN